MPKIVLPVMYEEVSTESARKGEDYAKQLIERGYSGDSRDALSVLSAIIFEQQRRIDRLMAIR